MQLWEVQTVGGAIVGGAAVEGAITGVQLVGEAAGGWGVQVWGCKNGACSYRAGAAVRGAAAWGVAAKTKQIIVVHGSQRNKEPAEHPLRRTPRPNELTERSVIVDMWLGFAPLI